MDCPIGSEDILEDIVETLGVGRVIKDPQDPGELFYAPSTEDDDGGWAVVRVRDVDPQLAARELQRRILGLRIVGVYQRRK